MRSCGIACYPSLLSSRLSIAPFFEVKLVAEKEIILLDLVGAWMRHGSFLFRTKKAFQFAGA